MEHTFASFACTAGEVACGVLGWRPGEFWDATPAELALALAPWRHAQGQMVTRADLERLIEKMEAKNG